jgi:hypothetical protein
MQEGAQIEMAFVLDRPLAPPASRRVPAETDGNEDNLEISVIFTSVEPTLRALKQAASLAKRLAGHIALVVPQIVPYPLPLSSPPVLLEFNERRFFTLANDSHVETTVRIYMCRDRLQALMKILRPCSMVVLGGRKRWWPTAESRIAKHLKKLGHEVVLVETE